MAAKDTAVRRKKKVRKGVHSKTKTSKLKSSKLYNDLHPKTHSSLVDGMKDGLY